MLQPVAQTDAFEHFGRLAAPSAAAHALVSQRQRDVINDAGSRQEIEALEDEPMRRLRS